MLYAQTARPTMATAVRQKFDAAACPSAAHRRKPIIIRFTIMRHSVVEAARERPMKILFVDDDAMNRRVVKDMLDVVGAVMDEAESGEAGLSKIDSEDYAVILMDLRMPGMDGITAIREIRARSDHKARLPILVVTADMSQDLQERCTGAGADGVLRKPVAMAGLIDAIGRVMVSRSGDSIVLT